MISCPWRSMRTTTYAAFPTHWQYWWFLSHGVSTWSLWETWCNSPCWWCDLHPVLADCFRWFSFGHPGCQKTLNCVFPPSISPTIPKRPRYVSESVFQYDESNHLQVSGTWHLPYREQFLPPKPLPFSCQLELALTFEGNLQQPP